MTSTDWHNIFLCAQLRRESENLSNSWYSADYPRFVELVSVETSMLLKMAKLTAQEVNS